MLFRSLTDRLRDGLVAIAEYGKPEDADALLEKFHMMALELFKKTVIPQELEVMEEMKSVKPESIKDVERILRDAGGLSRSQSKHLASLVWVSQRDVEIIQEPELKSKNEDVELRKSLLEKASKFIN